MLPRPEIGSYTPAASFLPVLAPALGVVPAFLLVACALLVAVALRERFAHQQWVRTTLWSLLVATAVVLVPPELQASAPTWVAGAVCVAALLGVGLYASTIRPIVVPALVATVFALRSLGSAWSHPYPGARLGELIAAVALAALAWWWTREIARAGEEPAA